MTLILKPKGRGNWATVTMTLDAPADLFPALRAQPVAVGMVVQFAGLMLRVCEVRP
ncbi:hypothetical protein [uncultured Rhodoferax sp.]|uniref:hypothetical protein n=1 Tax=uncultured Rhodoferax sp. TaxID=223188 RepID=UPI0025DA95AD|nr:hypothetical protein [uncultured Rhodoferax sp.]